MSARRAEGALIGTAALLVFSRVFGLSVVLPNFRGHYDAIDPVLVGVAFGAYGLTMALMQLPTGMLSDRIGRKPLLFSATAFFVVGSLVCAWADSAPVLIAGRLLQGMGAVASVAVAAVGETVPASRRTFAMAMVGIPAGAGFLLGVLVGPLLYPVVGMTGLFLLAGSLALLAGLPLPWLRIAPPMDRPEAPRASRSAVLALAVAGFASQYALTSTLFFLPTDDGVRLAPLLVFALVFVGGFSRRIDKAGWTWQPVVVGLVGLPLVAAGFVLLPGAWGLVVGALFFAFHATLSTVLPSQVSRVSGPAGGRGHGIQNLIAYLGTFTAGAVGGALVAWSEAAMGAVVAIGFVAAGLVLVTSRAQQRS